MAGNDEEFVMSRSSSRDGSSSCGSCSPDPYHMVTTQWSLLPDPRLEVDYAPGQASAAAAGVQEEQRDRNRYDPSSSGREPSVDYNDAYVPEEQDICNGSRSRSATPTSEAGEPARYSAPSSPAVVEPEPVEPERQNNPRQRRTMRLLEHNHRCLVCKQPCRALLCHRHWCYRYVFGSKSAPTYYCVRHNREAYYWE